MKKIKNDLPQIINSYFTKHLMLERKFSDATYDAYLMVITQFIDYLKSLGVKATDVSFAYFTKENILSFLKSVEDNGCCAKTRNHKLAVINSFLEYAQSINPIYLENYMQSKSIKLKKVVKKKMDFMTLEETEIYFKSIDLKHKSGYAHYVMLTLLYETATRVSEMINIKVSDCFLSGEHPYIKILGKGSKERIVYVNKDLAEMINEYMDKLNIHKGYLIRNHSNQQITRSGVNKLVSKYHEIAKKECPTLANKTITPHTFRHSKAVHFLQNNTALPIIQRFLGHSSIKTTEIYLDLTDEVIIESVKLAAEAISIEKVKATWQGDEKLLSLLDGLK